MEAKDETNGKEAEDVELADVRLLNEPSGSDGQAHSWYSANGRGFTVDGRQTETSGGVSHVGTVLGESYYARERSARSLLGYQPSSQACYARLPFAAHKFRMTSPLRL